MKTALLPMVAAMVAAMVASAVLLAIPACGTATGQASREFAVGDAQNGQTIQVRVGDQVQVSLASTYWTFSAPSDTSVMALLSDPVVSPAPLGSCLPGVGCGSVIARFKALKAGQANLTATRVTCGEALRCVGPSGGYEVTVTVG